MNYIESQIKKYENEIKKLKLVLSESKELIPIVEAYHYSQTHDESYGQFKIIHHLEILDKNKYNEVDKIKRNKESIQQFIFSNETKFIKTELVFGAKECMSMFCPLETVDNILSIETFDMFEEDMNIDGTGILFEIYLKSKYGDYEGFLSFGVVNKKDIETFNEVDIAIYKLNK